MYIKYINFIINVNIFKDKNFYIPIQNIMNKYFEQLDFKEEDSVYLIIGNKINKEKSYIVQKLEYEEGGTFYDGFEVKINAYLEDNNTKIVEKIQVAFFSELNRIKSIMAYNINNFNVQ